MGDETVRMQKVTDEAVTKALAATASQRTGLSALLTPERLITGVIALLLGGGVSGVSTNAFNGNEIQSAQALAVYAVAERTEMRERHDDMLKLVYQQCHDFVEQCTDLCGHSPH